MKKRNRTVIFTVSALLTVGVFTYNDLESKAKATSDLIIKDNNEIHTSDRSAELNSNELVQNPYKQKTMDEEKVPVVDGVNKKASPNVEQSIVERSQAEDKKPVKCGTGTTTKEKETKTVNPETRVIDGYTFVNITDSAEENLADLIEVAKKHNAALYAIEYSDSFAMYSNDTGEPLIMFSTGSRSVSVEHAAILYDMHPSIKEQIKSVVETGKETIVELGEFESYHISKTDGRIYLSF
ncbi:hypothetical protein ABE41_015215 [Fictibacillus arsenicus]|uniref:Uncharacterized protein n=1 Tax=Fictibacillus arsenicus TaxID=255247 RepID=A0A1B1Z7B1_9BACL|nr:hypothetical protein [Fictibacillus arsenicus]ANX13357.1 hypothetical protein ABE41_015215 [Fictibacillus arsenicus]